MAGKRVDLAAHVSCWKRHGEDMKAAAAELGLTEKTLLMHLHVAGAVPRKAGGSPPVPADIRAEIISLYQGGAGGTTLAREFNLDKRTIYNILNAAGVGTRSVASRRKEYPAGRLPRMTDRDATIRDMALEGWEPKEIAHQLNLTSYLVTYSLKKQGLFVPEKADLAPRQVPTYIPVEREEVYRTSAFSDLLFNPIGCYWAGFLFADGSLSVPLGRTVLHLTVNLQRRDRDHLLKLRSFIGGDHRPLYDYESFTFGAMRKFSRLSASSNSLLSPLAEIGLTTHKQGRVPPDSLLDSVDFWRGMVDGDGSIYRRGVGTGYLSGSRTVVDLWAAFILRNNGSGCRFYQNQAGVWRGCVPTVAECRRVFGSLYYPGCVCLDRKNSSAQTHLKEA